MNWSTVDDKKVITYLAMGLSGTPIKQSVPRAEVYAATRAVDLLQQSRPGRLHPDATYVSRGASDDSVVCRRRLQGKNGDLWESFYSQLDDAHGQIDCTQRVNAHADVHAFKAGNHPIEHFIGNAVADALAAGAVKRALAASRGFEEVVRWEQRAFSVCQRMAVVEAWKWKEGADQEPRPIPPLPAWDPPSPVAGETPSTKPSTDKGTCFMLKDGGWFARAAIDAEAAKVGRPGPTSPCEAIAGGTIIELRKRGLQAEATPQWCDAPDQATAVLGTTIPSSASKRRKLMDARSSIAKARKAHDMLVERSAWSKAVRVTANPKGLELDIIQAAAVPFKFDGSHSLIICGKGAAGCERCGITAVWCGSSRSSSNAAWDDFPEGSKGPIRKLRRAEHPHAQRGRQGRSWQRGEEHARPFRVGR